jgi:hypothetical protein
MLRPWGLFTLVLGITLAITYEQGFLTWPQRIALGLCFALLIWRFVHKLRTGIRADRNAREETHSQNLT